MKTFDIAMVLGLSFFLGIASAQAGGKVSCMKGEQNQGGSDLVELGSHVAFSGTLKEIIEQVRNSSSSKRVKLASGIEISSGVILTLSHVLERVNDVLPGDRFESESTIKQNQKCIETSEPYSIIGESGFPRAISILSNSTDSFILRKASSDSNSYRAVSVFKDLRMDPDDKLSDDPVRILLESENAVLSKKAEQFILDWDYLDWSMNPSFLFTTPGMFKLEFAFLNSNSQESLRFLWDVEKPSVFVNWNSENVQKITGPSLHLGGGMSGGGVFIKDRGTYKLMGLILGSATDRLASDRFKKYPEVKKVLIQDGAQEDGDAIVRKHAIALKEVNFDQISKAIRDFKRDQ